MLYKPEASIDLISLLIHFTWTSLVIMASCTPKQEGVSIFDELPTLSSSTSDVYGSLLNNRLYVFQPNMNMSLDVIKSVMGW